MWERARPDPDGVGSWGRQLAVKPVSRGGRTTKDMCRRVVSPAPEASREPDFMTSVACCQMALRAPVSYMSRRSEAEPR